MTKNNLRDAIDRMGETAVDRFLRKDDALKKKSCRKQRQIYIQRTIAACLCLCIICGAIFIIRGAHNHIDIHGSETTTAASTSPDAVTTKGNMFDTEAFKEKYNGRSVNILCWDSEHPEFEAESETFESGDFLSEAIYKRNKLTSEALGLTLVFNEQDDDAGKAATILQYVEGQIADNAPLDVIALYSRTAVLLACMGHLLPLNYVSDYINLENPWYPKSIEKDTDIKGNTYYVSGDISTNMLFLSYGFIFNKDIVDNTTEIGYTSEELYTLVKDGRWTLEEMFGLVGEYYVDADGDGVKSAGDGFGLRCYNYNFDAFYYGAGLSKAHIDNETDNGDKLISVSEDYHSQKAIELSDRLGELISSDYGYNDMKWAPNFAEGNTIAIVSRLRDTLKILSSENGDMSYGLLPVPKYDTAQEEYKSFVGAPLTLWGISSSSRDYDREVISAAVIETLGYYAQKDTNEAVFRTVMDGSYSEKAGDAVSFDIIRRSVTIELGCVSSYLMNTAGVMVTEWAACPAKGLDWSKSALSATNYLNQYCTQISKEFYDLAGKFFPTPKP